MAIHRKGRSQLGVAERSQLGVLTIIDEDESPCKVLSAPLQFEVTGLSEITPSNPPADNCCTAYNVASLVLTFDSTLSDAGICFWTGTIAGGCNSGDVELSVFKVGESYRVILKIDVDGPSQAAQYGASIADWDTSDPTTLTFESSSQCDSWPATLTLAPVSS